MIPNEFFDELLAAKGKEVTRYERMELKFELSHFRVHLTKQAMPKATFAMLTRLAGNQEVFDLFLSSIVGDVGTFRRDIDRQFREEYVKPTYRPFCFSAPEMVAVKKCLGKGIFNVATIPV